MTVKELIEELQIKPPTYEVMKGDNSHLVSEAVTDHDSQKVILY